MTAEILAVARSTDTSTDALYSRVRLRLMPLLFACYLFAFIDRVNIGFAQLQMKQSLGITDAQYGLAAGIFFIGYALFEVPSNMLFRRVGARKTFLRIMVSWGLCSTSTLFVTQPWHLYTLRFLLGVFEAGFFPGVILYLTYWFPRSKRGATTGFFLMASVAAGVVGAPVSGAILQWLSGALGLQGWQWLFLLLGLPACVLGVLCFFCLDDRPSHAKWLSGEERVLIEECIAAEEREHHLDVNALPNRSTFGDVQVYLLSFIYFALAATGYAINFWLPTLIRSAGVSDFSVIGWYAFVPAMLAALSVVFVSRSSDQRRERKKHLLCCVIAAALGLAGAAIAGSLPGLIVAISLANMGAVSGIGLFWSIPPTYLDARRAPVGIALISTLGILAGFVMPGVMGYLKTTTGTLTASMLMIVGLLMVACQVAMWMLDRRAWRVDSR